MEFLLFKKEFPFLYDSFLSMGYYFYKHKKLWKFKIEKCITNPSEKNILNFIEFYKESFKKMLQLSINELDILFILQEKRKDYNIKEKEQSIQLEIYKFLLRNENFQLLELRTYLNKKIIDKKLVSSRDLEDILKNQFNKEVKNIDIKSKFYESLIYINNPV